MAGQSNKTSIRNLKNERFFAGVVEYPRAPVGTDIKNKNNGDRFEPMTLALDTATGDLWYLAGFSAGVADWRKLADAEGAVTTLLDQVNVQVDPNVSGQIAIDGLTVANAANPSGIPLETVAGTNTLVAQVQVGAAVTGAPADKNDAGLISADDTVFTLDANGWMSLSTTGLATTITGDSGGALSPVANNWNILGGTGVSTAGAGATLTINASGGGFTWVDVTTTSDAIEANTGYIANNAGLVTLTLPATCAVGDCHKVAGLGAGGWKVAQNASQLINFGNMTTTTGVGGSLASTNQFDALELLCVVTNTTWVVLNSVGNITVT